MSHYNPFDNRYGPRPSGGSRGFSPESSPTYSFRGASFFGYRRRYAFRSEDSFQDEPFADSPPTPRRGRSLSPPPRRSEPRPHSRENPTYERLKRWEELFNGSLSEYARKRLTELFDRKIDLEMARRIVEIEEMSQSRPPPRHPNDSPPRRRQPSFDSPRDERKPWPRNYEATLSEYAKRRMDEFFMIGMDYEVARRIVEEEEAEAKPKKRSGKPDIYSNWDCHPNAGRKEKYQVSHTDMKMYIKMMEELVGTGMSRTDAVKIIDKEIHNSLKSSGQAPGSGSFYDPRPRRPYSSSRRYRSASPPRSGRRDDRYGESRRGRDDNFRYGY